MIPLRRSLQLFLHSRIGYTPMEPLFKRSSKKAKEASTPPVESKEKEQLEPSIEINDKILFKEAYKREKEAQLLKQKELQKAMEDLEASKENLNREEINLVPPHSDGVQLMEEINKVNKYFLGFKINTNYLKTYQEVSVDNIPSSKEIYRVTDLPFAISIKDDKLVKEVEQDPRTTRAGKLLFTNNRYEPILSEMKSQVMKYFQGLVTGERLARIEPNFELRNILVMKSLQSEFSFNLIPLETEPDIRLLSITLMKGLQVCRNDNYSNDSYQKDESDSQDGIITYQLNKLPKEDYPEKEWFSTKMINARLEVSASNCPEVTLHTKNGKLIGSNNGINHHFVFEADLIKPPLNADLHLTPEELYK